MDWILSCCRKLQCSHVSRKRKCENGSWTRFKPLKCTFDQLFALPSRCSSSHFQFFHASSLNFLLGSILHLTSTACFLRGRPRYHVSCKRPWSVISSAEINVPGKGAYHLVTVIYKRGSWGWLEKKRLTGKYDAAWREEMMWRYYQHKQKWWLSLSLLMGEFPTGGRNLFSFISAASSGGALTRQEETKEKS